MNTRLSYIMAGLGLYLASSVGAFATFSFVLPQPVASVEQPQAQGNNGFASLLDIDPGEPKTEACPLNGKLFTMTEREAWESKWPLAVMIENSPDARPQSGLSGADMVYEAVAEGGVTRFMAMVYCEAVSRDTLLAPVRSARSYFVEWASGYNRPIYAHIGGANCSAPKDENGNQAGPCMTQPRVQAIEQLERYGWRLRNDVDGMSVGLPVFKRNATRLGPDRYVATEHTVETSSERLWAFAKTRGFAATDPDGDAWVDGFTGWSFSDEPFAGNNAPQVSYEFWDGYSQYGVAWSFDGSKGRYLRAMAGTPHLDLNTGTQIEFETVVVLFTKEEGPVDELKHMWYQTTGKGDALIFHGGKVQEVTWSKANRESELVFLDSSNQPLSMPRGKVWISVLGTGTAVAY